MIPALVLVLAQTLHLVQGKSVYPTVQWDQSATTLVEAQGYTYRYYLDGNASGAALSVVTCNGTASPFTCQGQLPVTVSGQHTIALTAETDPSHRSAQSEIATFTFVPSTAPAAPYSVVLGR